MEVAKQYSVHRTFDPDRGPWGRWEVRNAAGVLVGVVAEQPAAGRRGAPSTFTVGHNPSPVAFNLRYPRHLRSRGAWWSGGHATVAAAVAALAGHLHRTADGRPARHYMTGSHA